jgi:flavin-dependent dehydrogenase
VVVDVAIAGAGPAGASLAIALARAGARVTLFEKDAEPRLKACGEGILPHGVRALAEVAGGLPDGARVRGLRFVAGGMSVVADFPEGFGLVVRRDRLHAWLRERAAATPGVDLRLATRYAPCGESFTVGADGLRSQFHRRLPARAPVVRRVGLSTHFGGVEGIEDRVEVFFHEAGEIYLAPCGGGEALVAALFHQDRFHRNGLVRLLRAIPELRERTATAEQTTPMLAAAPLGLQVPKVVDDRLLLIGDAAGAPDPITGDGLAIAFASVAPAVTAIASGDLAEYQRVRGAIGRTAERLGRLLIGLGRFQGRGARALLRRPGLVPTLLDVAVARRPLGAATLLRAFL